MKNMMLVGILLFLFLPTNVLAAPGQILYSKEHAIACRNWESIAYVELLYRQNDLAAIKEYINKEVSKGECIYLSEDIPLVEMFAVENTKETIGVRLPGSPAIIFTHRSGMKTEPKNVPANPDYRKF